MKLDVQETGTAGAVLNRLDEMQRAASKDAVGADELAAVEGAFTAVGSVLSSVENDRQATVTMSGEARGAELVHVYLDVTIVPSAAAQEAKAAAEPETASSNLAPAINA